MGGEGLGKCAGACVTRVSCLCDMRQLLLCGMRAAYAELQRGGLGRITSDANVALIHVHTFKTGVVVQR